MVKLNTEAYKGFPTNGLNESIHNLCYEFGPDASTSNLGGVPVHTQLPFATLMDKSWCQHSRVVAIVVPVLHCASRDFLRTI